MATLTFDRNNFIMTVPASATEITCQEIYDQCRDYEDEPSNMDLAILVKGAGKDDLGGSRAVGLTVTILNNWRLAFEARGGPTWVSCLVSGGNLVAVNDYDNNPIYPTSYTQVTIAQSTSPTLIGIGIPAEVADAVWDEVLANHDNLGTAGNALMHIALDDKVYIDTINGQAGTAFPLGLGDYPVNNLADAKIIAETHSIRTLQLDSNLVVGATESINDYVITAPESIDIAVILTPGCTTLNTRFFRVILMGTFNGKSYIETCTMLECYNFSGFIIDSVFMDNVSIVDPDTPSLFNACGGGKVSPPIELDLNDSSLNIGGWKGEMKIVNKDGPSANIVELMSGQVTIDSTCIAGTIVLKGLGRLVADNSGVGCTVITTDLHNEEVIADAVWDEDFADHQIAGSVGLLMQHIMGLVGQNVKWSNITHDANNNTTGATLTQYTDNTLVTPFKVWAFTAAYNGDSELLSHELKEV